jgi:hypothetical protein
MHSANFNTVQISRDIGIYRIVQKQAQIRRHTTLLLPYHASTEDLHFTDAASLEHDTGGSCC